MRMVINWRVYLDFGRAGSLFFLILPVIVVVISLFNEIKLIVAFKVVVMLHQD